MTKNAFSLFPKQFLSRRSHQKERRKEKKKYRKDDNNCYHFRKEDVFPEEKENKKEIEKEKEKVNKTEEIIEEVTANKNGDSEEKGFKITILEGNIEDNDINTSSKNKEQRLDDLD